MLELIVHCKAGAGAYLAAIHAVILNGVSGCGLVGVLWAAPVGFNHVAGEQLKSDGASANADNEMLTMTASSTNLPFPFNQRVGVDQQLLAWRRRCLARDERPDVERVNGRQARGSSLVIRRVH